MSGLVTSLSFKIGVSMSFFNLTHMGYENTISESLTKKSTGAADGSHVKFNDLKTKHTRSEHGNHDTRCTRYRLH